MAVVTAALLRKLWGGAVEMRVPLVGYAAALALMVVSAFAAFPPGGVPLSAALGAGLFYVSDASLALNLFSRPIQWAPLLTLGVYWLGQLGIALAARAPQRSRRPGVRRPGRRRGPGRCRAARPDPCSGSRGCSAGRGSRGG